MNHTLPQRGKQVMSIHIIVEFALIAKHSFAGAE